uniref:Uncharacterized protein n=1 Tax=Bos indicus x Bos taurus TaxID=30522 RepID=A0A4W2D8A5_BOBOX
MSCLYILEINPLSVVSFAKIFFHSEGCLFTLFIVSFSVQKFLSLIRSHMFTFTFISITLGGGVLSMFSSKSFIVSVIFVYDVRKCSNFILLHVAVQCSQHHSLKRLQGPHFVGPPGSSVHGISQGRILEWVAISFSRRSSQPRN